MKKKDDKKEEKKKDENKFENFDEFMKKFFSGTFKPPFGSEFEIDIGEYNPQTPNSVGNHYSISYKYDNNMKKPEIHLNGRSVDEETLKKLIKEKFPEGINFYPENELGYLPSEKPTENIIDVGDLNLADKQVETKDEYLIPYYDTYQEDGSFEITMELPGVVENNILINYMNKSVIINADDGEGTFYRKQFELDFEPDTTKTEITGKNWIYTITLEK